MGSRRLLAVVLVVLAALTGAAAPAAHAASATVVECVSAAEQAERRVGFTGTMDAVPGTSRMQMRFTLQSSAASTGAAKSWKALAAPGLDAWVSAKPGVKRYVFTKRIGNLVAPARYRASVRFRWLDAAGVVIRRRRAYSRTCRQLDFRANLATGPISIVAGETPSTALYRIPVLNSGKVNAAASELLLTVNGAPRPAVAIPSLLPGAQHTATVEGPRCAPGTKLLVSLDAAGAVAERDEDDNQVTISCS